MPLRTQLVHAEAGRRVVRASAWEAGECLGSALGEAATAEEAEDRAIERLRRRLALAGGQRPQLSPQLRLPQIQRPGSRPRRRLRRPRRARRAPDRGEARSGSPACPRRRPPTADLGPRRARPACRPPRRQPRRQPRQALPPAATAPGSTGGPGGSGPGRCIRGRCRRNAWSQRAGAAPDPEDWSDELAQVELELQRLGWGREQEAAYLERVFGHPSRGRLTRYADLGAYLGVLRRAPIGADPAALPAPCGAGTCWSSRICCWASSTGRPPRGGPSWSGTSP